MDFAGFCDEAVRAFLLRGRDALFFVLLYAAGGLLRSGRRVGRGIPRRYIPCRWYEFWKGKGIGYDGDGAGRAERRGCEDCGEGGACGYPGGGD